MAKVARPKAPAKKKAEPKGYEAAVKEALNSLRLHGWICKASGPHV